MTHSDLFGKFPNSYGIIFQFKNEALILEIKTKRLIFDLKNYTMTKIYKLNQLNGKDHTTTVNEFENTCGGAYNEESNSL